MLVHSGPVILPELGESLGRYTQKVLARRGVEIRLNTRVKSMTENSVFLVDGVPIPCRTLVWTAGTVPSPLISSLPCAKERGRIRVNQFLQVPDWPDVWAVGDCAFVPDIKIRGNLIRQPRNMPYAKARLWRRISRLHSWVVGQNHFRSRLSGCWLQSVVGRAWRGSSVSIFQGFSPGGCGGRFI